MIAHLRLLWRLNRTRLLAWWLGLWGLMASVASYESYYPTSEEREAFVRAFGDTISFVVMYGPLEEPGRLGQFANWEVGTYVVTLAAVMGVMVAGWVSRKSEDDGTAEAFRASGVGPRSAAVTAIVALLLAVAVLSLGVVGTLTAMVGRVDDLTVAGAAAFGGMVAAVSAVYGLLALALGAAGPSARWATTVSLGVVGLSFVARAAADVHDIAWLNWVSPLGWRTLVGAYSQDRWPALLPALGICAALAWATLWCAGRREFGGSLLPSLDDAGRPRRVRGMGALALVRERSQAMAWLIALGGIAAFFGSITQGMLDAASIDEGSTALLQQMGGSKEMREAFFGLTGRFVVIAAMSAVLGTAVRGGADELAGRADTALAAGASRGRLFGAQACAALVLLLAVQAVCSVALSWAAEASAGKDVWVMAMRAIWTQTPGMLAIVGVAVFIVSLAPQAAGASWALFAASAAVTLLGDLLKLPDWVMDASPLGHGTVQDEWLWRPWGALIGVGIAGLLGAWLVWRNRDIRVG